MASIRSALLSIKSRPHEQLERHLPASAIEEVCHSLGHRWRKRVLGPATSVHLMLLQLLAGVALGGLRHLSGLAVSAQAIARARTRLPLELFIELVAKLLRPPATAQAPSLWKGLRLWVADAMSFLTPDTPELAARYGRAQNQRGVSDGYPVPKLLCLLEHATGMIAKAIALPHCRQEQTCLTRLFSLLGAGDLLLGDRGLVGFAQLALLKARGAAGLMQLPSNKRVAGRGKGRRRRVAKLGRQDLLLRWYKGDERGRPRWMSKARWRGLPDSLELRQVAFRIKRKGHRDHWAWVITTLTDPRLYPSEQIAELYGRRWQVEVCFRDLKNTLGLKRLSSRSEDGLRKELLAFILLYNLVRKVMAEAAAAQGVEADRISFTDATRWLLYSQPGTPLPRLLVNGRRTRPTQPRAVKHGGRRFPKLKHPRQTLQQPAAKVRI